MITDTTEDIVLVKNVKEYQCQDSLMELINKHTPLWRKIFNKYEQTLNKLNLSTEEALKDKDYLIYKSIISFNVKKGCKFSTWMGNQARYYCLNVIKENKKYLLFEDKEISHVIDQQGFIIYNNKSNYFDDQLQFVYNVLGQLKDKRIKKVYELRYFSEDKNTSWSKISEQLGVSIQTVINLHQRGRKILKNKFNYRKSCDLV